MSQHCMKIKYLNLFLGEFVLICICFVLFSGTPILKIVQLILNEDALYHTILNLPVQQNVLTAVGTMFTHPRFKEIEGKLVFNQSFYNFKSSQ